MIHWLIILTLSSTKLVECEHEHKTTLAIKQGTNDYRDSVPVGVESFSELVKKSKMFVDTSLFIEDFMNVAYNGTMIVGPRKFGKTINVDMLKMFFEIQVDEYGNATVPLESTTNYKLFRKGEITLDDGTVEKLKQPLLISSRTEFVEKYQGQIPVIYANFKDVVGDDYETLEKSFLNAISRAFVPHKYLMHMLRRLNESDDDIDSYCGEQGLIKYQEILDHVNQTREEENLSFLCGMLHEHFGKEPILILDDYDMPIRNILSNSEFPIEHIQKVLDMMDLHAIRTFAGQPYLFRGIITGTFQPGQTEFTAQHRYYMVHDVLTRHTPLAQYFGFNEREVRALLDKHSIAPKLADDALVWYNGYESENTDIRFYNPFSISQFLSQRQLTASWRGFEDQSYKDKVFEIHPIIRETFFLIFRNYDFAVSKFPILDIRKLRSLRRLYCPEEKPPEDTTYTNVFLWYLYRDGYLTIDVEKQRYYPLPERNRFHCVKIPNKEVLTVISNWTLSYYKRRYLLDESRLQTAAENLLNIIRGKTDDTTLLHDFLLTVSANFTPPPCITMIKYHDNITTIKDANSTATNTSGNLTATNYKRNATITNATLDDVSQHPINILFNVLVMHMRYQSKFQITSHCLRHWKTRTIIVDKETNTGAIIALLDASIYFEYMSDVQKYAFSLHNILEKIAQMKTWKIVSMKINPNRTMEIDLQTIQNRKYREKP